MIPTNNKPTVADLTLWLSERELSDMTNPAARNNCDDQEADTARLENGIELADALWCSKYVGCKPEGKVALIKIRKPVTLMLARYFLDREKTRPSVIEQYNNAIALMENACCSECDGEISAEDAELIGWDTSTSKVYVYSEDGTLDRSQTANYQRGGLFGSHQTRFRDSQRKPYGRRGRRNF